MPITTPPADDATSYATPADLQDYADARGITLEGEPEQLLIRAMDYTRSLAFPGRRTDASQPLAWPRTGARIGPDKRRVAPDEVPPEVVDALLVTAVSIDEGNDPLAPVERAVKKEEVGPLAVTYQDNATARPINVALNRAWRYIATGGVGGGNQLPVVRV